MDLEVDSGIHGEVDGFDVFEEEVSFCGNSMSKCFVCLEKI